MSAPCPQFSSQGMRGCILPQQHNGLLLVLIFSQCVFTPLLPSILDMPILPQWLVFHCSCSPPLREAYCKQRQKSLEISTYTVFIQHPSNKGSIRAEKIVTATLALNLAPILLVFSSVKCDTVYYLLGTWKPLVMLFYANWALFHSILYSSC